MKLIKVVGLVSLVALTWSSPCRPDDTITFTLDNTQKNHAAEAPKTSAAKKTITRNTSAQSAAQSRAIGRLGVVSKGVGKIYAGRSEQTRLYFECQSGTYLALTDTIDHWYGVLMSDGRTGWIRTDNVNVLGYELIPSPGSTTGKGQQIVQTAFKFLGVPYVWGGNTTNGIDCSGFVKRVFAANGISLPRTAREQCLVGYAVQGSQIQPGDRLYFSCKGRMVDHTGIYIGNNYFIHSSGSRGGVAVDSIFKKTYYNSLVAIRRS